MTRETAHIGRERTPRWITSRSDMRPISVSSWAALRAQATRLGRGSAMTGRAVVAWNSEPHAEGPNRGSESCLVSSPPIATATTERCA